MDNQHRKIKGYRDLSEAEIALMNTIKSEGVALEWIVTKLENLVAFPTGEVVPDPRWLAIGKTHLQQGLMALTRAVAKPDFF
jgi:hypothetical protein